MLLHIGGDTSVALKGVVAVLNMESLSEDTEEFISSIRKKGCVLEAVPPPHKSCVVTMDGPRVMLYMSAISATTLSARAELGRLGEQF
ncbi:MAG: DUF370 domain-containing protein [Clostridia bacterium]|nr:DUF370 domain-containing protein [Clostridia bacterium]